MLLLLVQYSIIISFFFVFVFAFLHFRQVGIVIGHGSISVESEAREGNPRNNTEHVGEVLEHR